MLYKKDEIIEVEITALKPYGAFAKVDDEYSGLIHISEINGLFIKDINDVFKIGDKKKVRILDVDEEKKQIKLSMILDKNGKRRAFGRVSRYREYPKSVRHYLSLFLET